MSDDATRRILSGPLAREIARFGTPLAVGMALQTTFNLVDAYLVAQLPHEEAESAIGALGICDQIAAIGTIVSYGISTATSTLLSQQKGAGKLEAVQRTAWQSILIVAALSILFAIGGVAFSGIIVRDLIGAKGQVAEDATRYLRVIVGGSFSIFFLLQLTSIQRALGSSKTPVVLLVLGNVLNIFLAILMIFGPDERIPGIFAWATPIAKLFHIPRMGLMGAAWATIIARTLVLVPILFILARRFKIVRPPKGDRGPHWKDIRRILDIAWPSSAQFVIRIAAMLLINSLVARAYTQADDQRWTTAIGLVFRLDTMALFIAMGWGSAAQTFVGQNIGARQDARATRSGWITALYDGITNIGLLVVLYYFSREILLIFDSTDLSPDGPVEKARVYLKAVAPSYLGLGLGVVLGNAMAGAGATKKTMMIDVCVILGLQFPACIIGVAFLKVEPETLFLFVTATNFVSAAAYSWVYWRGHWRQNLAPPSSRPPPMPASSHQ